MSTSWLVRAIGLIAVGSSSTVWALDPGEDGPVAATSRRRAVWTGSKIAGTPEPPPPYTVELAFPRLKFQLPVVLVPAKGTNRLFLGELKGRILSFRDEPGCDRADLALDVAALHPDLTNFYGIAFHPKFDETHYVYVCYVLKNDLPDGSVVSRFTVRPTDPPVIDPGSEQVLLRFWSGGHNGGCLDFGTDGYLYISAGDGAIPTPPDSMNTGQDCSDFLSSVLRIDVDHSEPGRPYRIPPDNPFLNMPGVRPEIWAFGFRNPWRMSIDRATGDLWVGDVGWELWEMVHKVKRGGNYGWSVMEGPQPVRVESKRGPSPILPPLKVHPHSEAASITGGYVYHGRRLPELEGAYIYGDYQSGILWGLRARGDTVTWEQEIARTPLHLSAFGQGADGELYLLDHDRTHQVYRLVKNPASSRPQRFPRRLSETGLFASTAEHKPATGVIPYAINSELWSDGLMAERFLAVPGSKGITPDHHGNWLFPNGSVLVRTVKLPSAPGEPASDRRLETQILHQEDDAWRPYSYVWNDDQTDATLVDAQGATKTIKVKSGAVTREVTHRVSARTECVLCHNPWVGKKTTIFGVQSASPLGVNSAQLNRKRDKRGDSVNQLTALYRIGLLGSTPDPARTLRLVDPYDESANLDRRARSYLQTNCAHCHQFGAGGSANIVLAFDTPLESTRTIGERPIQGTFNIAGAHIITPGDPAASVLYYRISKLGGGRMPRIGSNQVDVRASKLIYDWIARMPRAADTSAGGNSARAEDIAALGTLLKPDSSTAAARAAAIQSLSSNTRGALMLLALIDHNKLSETLRRDVIAATKDSPHVEIRDLFERFIPESDRVKRLGDVVDRGALLNLKGDATRGRLIFTANPAAQCKTCHKLGDTGQNVGPDLAKIGAKYPKPALLDQILEPSKIIDPPFLTYLIETKDGRVLTGLVTEKTSHAVVLKDAQGKTLNVPAAEIEQLVPQSRSLMPELLLRDLTAQQVADLLEFLTTLR